VVTGHLDHCVREFLQKSAADLRVEYVFNPIYRTTNNIYSLWLARQTIQEPFVLIESDLVFEESMLKRMLKPGKIAISHILPWMNGTTVGLNRQKGVSAFHVHHSIDDEVRYKTVNVYSLSLQSWRRVIAQLDHFIANKRVGDYYEAVFADMVADGSLTFDAVFFEENRWYEIDTIEDLHQAELLFTRPPKVIADERWLEPPATGLQNIGVSGKTVTA
jgi:choline kinase